MKDNQDYINDKMAMFANRVLGDQEDNIERGGASRQ